MTRYDVLTEPGTNGAAVATGDSTGLTVSKSGTAGPPSLTYSTTKPAHGSKSIHVVAGVNDTACCILQPFAAANGVARMYENLDSLPGVFTQKIAIRNSSTNMALCGLDASGRFSVQGTLGQAIANDTNPVPTGASVRYELGAAKGATGTGDGRIVAAWYLGDSTTPQWSIDVSNGNTGTADVNNIRLGKPNSGGSAATYIDDVAAADGTITLLGPAGNIAPTGNAGSDQTIAAGTTLTLAGSGSDPDGTITTYAWTKVSGPAVTITNAGTATASVAAIPKGHYVFRLTVTDDGGSTAFDEVTVNVTGTSARPDSLVSNGGGWAIVGGASSLYAALADESDTTYVETPDNPAGAVLEVGVEPLQAGQVGYTYRYQASASTPARSLVTELRMGATVIASQTDTPSTSWVTGTITLDSSQQAAISGRTDLRLRFVAS